MKMIRPIQYDRQDTCPLCKSERSIEGYTVYNKPVHLSLAIDKRKDVRDRQILFLKCTKCNTEFFPRWINGYPTPMVESNFIDFINGYRYVYEKSNYILSF